MVLKSHTSYFFKNQRILLSRQEKNHLRVINSEHNKPSDQSLSYYAIQMISFSVFTVTWVVLWSHLLLLPDSKRKVSEEKPFGSTRSVGRRRRCSWTYRYTSRIRNSDYPFYPPHNENLLKRIFPHRDSDSTIFR